MAYVDPDEYRMSLGDHLEDLRYRLIMGMIGPIVIAIVLLIFGEQIITFLVKPLMVALVSEGLDPRIYASSPLTAIGVYMKVSFIGGFSLGIPWLLWQLWQFIAPGLYKNERKFITMLFPGAAGLAVAGLAFMYYVMLPLMLWFLIHFTVSFSPAQVEPSRLLGDQSTTSISEEIPDQPEAFQVPMTRKDPGEPVDGQMWMKMPERELRFYAGGRMFSVKLKPERMIEPLFQLDQYISMVMWLGLAFSVAFQLPLIMLGLAKIGIVDYATMRAGWRWAMVISIALGAILTPQDPFSLIAMAVPLYLLYEFGLVLIRLFVRQPAADNFDA